MGRTRHEQQIEAWEGYLISMLPMWMSAAATMREHNGLIFKYHPPHYAVVNISSKFLQPCADAAAALTQSMKQAPPRSAAAPRPAPRSRQGASAPHRGPS